ncbi:MAG: GNAT family N-acetyltransferase [Trueperaceae bacterium]
MEIRELTDLAELRSCEQIQRVVWHPSEAEVVGLGQFRAAQHAGGLVAGAWRDGELIGFCYGFPAYRNDAHPPHGLHSHMTAVLPSLRNRGAGRALKWFQRDWCLARNISWVEWTFDPLRAANARLNLEYLGATVGEYLIDAYGSMDDDFNSGVPSDRLVARWDLHDPAVVSLQRGCQRSADPREHTVVLEYGAEDAPNDGLPCSPRLDREESVLSVMVPRDIGLLLQRSPQNALAWRLAVRSALCHYIEAGYRLTRFLDGSYHLGRNDGPAEN